MRGEVRVDACGEDAVVRVEEVDEEDEEERECPELG